ncbi:MAG: hypothetical protein ACRBBR_04865 [Cellvibrionaceae bacterium]
MEFRKIKRAVNEITLFEWEALINEIPTLSQLPDKTGVNPFTNEEVIFSGKGKALYKEEGNISLESGELLTTGVSESFCKELAIKLSAEVYEDDRS